MSEGPSWGAGEGRFVLLDFLFTVLRCQQEGERKVSQVGTRTGSQALHSCSEWVGLVARQLTAPGLQTGRAQVAPPLPLSPHLTSREMVKVMRFKSRSLTSKPGFFSHAS